MNLQNKMCPICLCEFHSRNELAMVAGREIKGTLLQDKMYAVHHQCLIDFKRKNA
jgi:hypothetical protein